MKILNTAPLPGAILQRGLESRIPGVAFSIADGHRFPEEELAAEIAEADLVLGDYTGGTPLNRRIVAAAKKVKLIQQPSAGYNHIDIQACHDFRIPVANTPGANDIGVAEHTIMLALACLKKLTYFDAGTHRGEWLFKEAQRQGIYEINGKTYGLLGMGRTARAVALRLIPFGVKLLYSNRTRLSMAEEEEYKATYATVEEILKTADVVSLHLPLTEETRGIIDASRLALMKPSAILINVGRGALVVEADLAHALRNGKLGAAASDVFSEEPPPKDHPFFGLDNMILTPHLAGSTRESGARIIGMVLDNLARVMRGEKPLWTL